MHHPQVGAEDTRKRERERLQLQHLSGLFPSLPLFTSHVFYRSPDAAAAAAAVVSCVRRRLAASQTSRHIHTHATRSSSKTMFLPSPTAAERITRLPACGRIRRRQQEERPGTCHAADVVSRKPPGLAAAAAVAARVSEKRREESVCRDLRPFVRLGCNDPDPGR